MSKPASSPSKGRVYKRRKPETAVLYQVLQEHLETFMARLKGGGGGANWPGFAERELRAFLRRRARRAGIREGQAGAVVFLQRFGGSVNLNPHFHALYLDGTRALLFDPLTFIEKLCALVPPPQANLMTCHGVLAPNAAWRPHVTPTAESAGVLPSRKKHRRTTLDEIPARERVRRYTWADLLKRVFKIDILACPFCQGRRKLIAFITEAPVVRAILECLELPADPPPLSPARWHP